MPKIAEAMNSPMWPGSAGRPISEAMRESI
jgi:hypothetical protein